MLAGAPTCPLWTQLALPNCPCSQKSDPVTCPAQECCHSFLFLIPNLGLSDSPTGWNYACRWRISPSSLPRPDLFLTPSTLLQLLPVCHHVPFFLPLPVHGDGLTQAASYSRSAPLTLIGYRADRMPQTPHLLLPRT